MLRMTRGIFKKIIGIGLGVYILTACTTSPMGSDTTSSASKSRNKGTFDRVTNQSLVSPITNKPLLSVALEDSAGGIATIEPLPSNASTGNLWDRLGCSFQLPLEEDNPNVQAQINWFLRHKDYLDRTSRRAAPYIYYIYEQVEQRNLPAELVLLPINESAYNPFANSIRGAGGVWQMTRGTAAQYGVKQNWWYDGRRDIYASTQAALDHLTYLQNFFNGDWLLAMAAYDCGEGTVQRAIRRNARMGLSTDFWSLPLPEETRSYVPRLLALAAIVRDRQRYHISLPPIDDQPYLAQVDIGFPINLGNVADLAGMRLADLKQLNPGYRCWTKTSTGPIKLVLPIDHIDVFKENLANFRFGGESSRDTNRCTVEVPHTMLAQAETNTPKPANLTNVISHQVKAGDNLNTLARLYRVSVKNIKAWNNLKSTHLKAGTTLIVGFNGEGTPTTAMPQGNPSIKHHTSTRFAHNHIGRQQHLASGMTVRPGDTLYSVAHAHHLTIASLKQRNNLKSNSLRPGQRLVV